MIWVSELWRLFTILPLWVIGWLLSLRENPGIFVDFPILNELPRATSYNIYLKNDAVFSRETSPTLQITMPPKLVAFASEPRRWLRGYASSQRRADWESQVAQAATFAQLRFNFFFRMSCGSFVVS